MKTQVSHNVFDKNAKNFYFAKVASNAVNLSKLSITCKLNMTFRYDKRQNRIKNILRSLIWTNLFWLDSVLLKYRIKSTEPFRDCLRGDHLHNMVILTKSNTSEQLWLFMNGQRSRYRASLHIRYLSNNSLVTLILTISFTGSQSANWWGKERFSTLQKIQRLSIL